MNPKKINILVPSGWGAKLQACGKGPKLLRAYLEPPTLSIEPKITLSDPLKIILDLNQRLAKCILKTLQKGAFPFVIGGDHTCAVGTWNGALQFKKNFGLIWIDAHLDSHTPETSPSKAWHGMSLRALLDKDHALSQKAFLNPKHLCLIGARAFEKEELEFLNAMKVRIYFMDEVKKRGFSAIFKEAIEYINQGSDGFGISLDIDAIDPHDAPGVGNPETDGIKASELLKCLSSPLYNKQLLAFELVEFNPDLDSKQKTLSLCLDIERRFQ